MKLALIGYGKMGKAIEQEAVGNGHTVSVTIDNEEEWHQKEEALRQSDVAVEFTTPATAIANTSSVSKSIGRSVRLPC